MQFICKFAIYALPFLISFNINAGVDTGVYACVAQRVVGIQSEGEKRYHGKIELPPEEKLFILTIHKQDVSDDKACASLEAYSDYLDSKLDNLVEKHPKNDYESAHDSISNYDFWMVCGTKYTATFSEGKYGLLRLASEFGFVYRSETLDILSLGSRFEGGASRSLTYTFFYKDAQILGGSGNYLETGICQKK